MNTPTVPDLFEIAQQAGQVIPFSADVQSFRLQANQDVTVRYQPEVNFWLTRVLGGQAGEGHLCVQVKVGGKPLYPEALQGHRITDVDPDTGRWVIYNSPRAGGSMVLSGQRVEVTVFGEPSQATGQDHLITLQGSQLNPKTVQDMMERMLLTPPGEVPAFSFPDLDASEDASPASASADPPYGIEGRLQALRQREKTILARMGVADDDTE